MLGNAADLTEKNSQEVVKAWMQSWFFVIVHEHQCIDSHTKFEIFLTSNKSLFQNCYNLTWDLWRNVKTKIFR